MSFTRQYLEKYVVPRIFHYINYEVICDIKHHAQLQFCTSGFVSLKYYWNM